MLAGLLFALFCPAQQPQPGIAEIEKFVDNLPKNNANTAKDLAATLNAYGFRKEAGLRGCFYWMMKNLKYDYKDTAFIQEHYYDHSAIIRNVLSGRGTICFGYALLFNRLAQELGYQSYVVTGYVKQMEKESTTGHAWVAVKMDTSWYMFDPTWGQRKELPLAGSVKHIEYSYFKVKPEAFLEDHIPYDPLWQFTYYPVSHKKFSTGADPRPARFFRFEDSLVRHFAKNDSQQKTDELRRILDSDQISAVLADYIFVLAAHCNDLRTEYLVRDRIMRDSKKYAVADSLFSAGSWRGQFAEIMERDMSTASQANKEIIKKRMKPYLDTAVTVLQLAVNSINDVINEGGVWRAYFVRLHELYRLYYYRYLALKSDYE